MRGEKSIDQTDTRPDYCLLAEFEEKYWLWRVSV